MRFQADRSKRGEPRRYRSVVSAFRSIWREEGLVHGLYKGVGTTTLRAAVLTGAQVRGATGWCATGWALIPWDIRVHVYVRT